MHRQHLLALLDAYQAQHPEEHSTVAAVVDLVRTHPDCFDRRCLPGHITGSAWIVSSDHQRFLLTHHRKLDRWLQLGGHADGETFAHRVALREAREESGLAALRFALPGGRLVPVDVDVHRIPARGADPEHWHHDIRWLLVADPGQTLVISDESHDLRWFEREALEQVADEPSLLRLGRKAWALLQDPEMVVLAER